MYLFNVVVLLLFRLTVCAARHRHQPRSYGSATTTTVTLTTTVADIVDPTSTSSASFPAEAYTIIASRSDASFHLLSINAAGFNFTLGGAPATYCPNAPSQCPAGNVTAFYGSGAMDAEVPGGQLVFVADDGRLGYTQAHSASYPPGAVLAPFTYMKARNTTYGYLGTFAFNAPGLMACPTARDKYQVFAAISNATVPSGNISDCTGFSALATAYQGNPVWQYD